MNFSSPSDKDNLLEPQIPVTNSDGNDCCSNRGKKSVDRNKNRCNSTNQKISSTSKSTPVGESLDRGSGTIYNFDRPWECTACTFINTDTKAVECKVCLTIRPGVVLGRGGRRRLSSRSPYYSNRNHSRENEENPLEEEENCQVLSTLTPSLGKKNKRKSLQDSDKDAFTNSMEGKENKTSKRRKKNVLDSPTIERNLSIDEELTEPTRENLFHAESKKIADTLEENIKVAIDVDTKVKPYSPLTSEFSSSSSFLQNKKESSLIENPSNNTIPQKLASPERKGGGYLDQEELEYDLESSDDDKLLKRGRLQKGESRKKEPEKKKESTGTIDDVTNDQLDSTCNNNEASEIEETTFEPNIVVSLEEEEQKQEQEEEGERVKESKNRNPVFHEGDNKQLDIEDTTQVDISTRVEEETRPSQSPSTRMRITVDENIIIDNESTDEDSEDEFQSSLKKRDRINEILSHEIEPKENQYLLGKHVGNLPQEDQLGLISETRNRKNSQEDPANYGVANFNEERYSEKEEDEMKEQSSIDDVSKTIDKVNNHLEDGSVNDCSDDSLEVYLQKKKRLGSLQRRTQKRRVHIDDSEEEEGARRDYKLDRKATSNKSKDNIDNIEGQSDERKDITKNNEDVSNRVALPNNIFSEFSSSDEDYDHLSVNKNQRKSSKTNENVDTISLSSSTSYSSSESSILSSPNGNIHNSKNKKSHISNDDRNSLYSSDFSSDCELLISKAKKRTVKTKVKPKSATKKEISLRSAATLAVSKVAKKNNVIDLDHFEDEDDDLSSLDYGIKSTTVHKNKGTNNRTTTNLKQDDESSIEEVDLIDNNKSKKKGFQKLSYDDLFDSEDENEESNNDMELDSMPSGDASNYNFGRDNKHTTLMKRSNNSFQNFGHDPYEEEDICGSFPSVSNDNFPDPDHHFNQNWSAPTKQSLNQVPPDYPLQLPHFRSWQQLKRYGQGGQMLSETKKKISGSSMSFNLKNTDAQSSTIHTGVNYDLFLYASTEANTSRSNGKLATSKPSSSRTTSRIGLSMDLYRRNGIGNSATDSMPLSYLALGSSNSRNPTRTGGTAIKDKEYEARKVKRLQKESKKKSKPRRQRRKGTAKKRK